ncbi:MAG: Hpt domain-containing protein [Candidatus Wallbacteria bacterium]|nr:Hpt domain-containing protein [Candidatus Wallbacteria bacterium]
MEDPNSRFADEAQGHLSTLEAGFMRLERTGSGDLAEMFRAAHSLKTIAGALERPAAATVAHALEELLALARDFRLPAGRYPSDVSLSAVDAVRRLLGAPPGEPPPQELLDGLRKAASLAGPTSDEMPPVPPEILSVLTEYQRERLRTYWAGGGPIFAVLARYRKSEFYSGAKALSDRLRKRGELLSLTAYASAAEGLDMAFVAILATDSLDVAALEGLTGQLSVRNLRLEPAQMPGDAPRPAPPSEAAPSKQAPAPAGHTAAPPAPEADDISRDPRFAALQANFLGSIPDRMDAFAQRLLDLERSPSDRDALDELFRHGHSLKGAGGTFQYPAITVLGHAMESVLDGVRRGRLQVTPALMGLLLSSADAVREVAQRYKQGGLPADFRHAIVDPLEAASRGEIAAQPAPSVSAPVLPAHDSVRVGLDRIDHLINAASELTLLKSQRAARVRHTDDLVRGLKSTMRRWRAEQEELELSRQPGPRRALDWIGTLLAQMERTVQQLQTMVDDAGREAAQIGRTAEDLASSLLSLRMLPLANLFAGLPRLVRDVARSLGKEVDVELVGADTEVDRRVLEELSDPLIHLVRNSLDHGLETPRERLKAGKPERGTLRLSATPQGGQVAIRVEDDGRGLDVPAIRRKAVAAGILSVDEAAAMSDRQAGQLIFRPGFTTREQVTAISGRGVGTDVVLATVRRLRGIVDVDFVPGKGTSFTLTVPLTMAVMQALRVRVGEEQYLIPALAVVEATRVDASRVELLDRSAVFEHRGSTLPIVALGPILETAVSGRAGAHLELVVVGAAERRLALAVDELVREETVVVEDCGRLVPSLPLIAGATIADDGRVVPVLDVPGVMHRAITARASTASPPRPTGPERARPSSTVLVVDDVMTTREMLRGLVELAGYRVLAADSAPAALAALRENTVDLVLADVEMPGMDGLELLERIRGDSRVARLPVVLVTGLASDELRRRGLLAGATAYLVKGQFDQKDLLRLIEREVG